MIQFPEGAKLIELGGGANPMVRPNVDVRPCQDAQGNQMVDFTADFDKPLPIQSDEWDGVICKFVIEHLSWRCVRQFISEVFRILKPGGKAVFITANTSAQIEWIKKNPEGWDNKLFFESASCIIFGDQDYPENTHKNWMDADTAIDLFLEAKFHGCHVQPYGERQTDILIEANKPGTAEPTTQTTPQQEPKSDPIPEGTPTVNAAKEKQNMEAIAGLRPVDVYDRAYFNGGGKVGGYAGMGYWDFPVHEITAQHILDRKPESVLEIGCARGYVLKRIEDAGIPGIGLEVSKHCVLTRASENVHQCDICNTQWDVEGVFDLCYSVATLEHIPEDKIDGVLEGIKRSSKRGLHGIDFGEKDDGFDKTHVLLRPESWWRKKFDEHGMQSHEVVNKEYLETGVINPVTLHGDTKVKLNIGCSWTMFHHGWINIDVIDQSQFANAYRYKFQQLDARQGLPTYGTSSVDLIFCCHMLEHLTYEEGLKFLKECRRVLKPDGVMRVIVPDAAMLMDAYQNNNLDIYDELNPNCAAASTSIMKLHCLMNDNHLSTYDDVTLGTITAEAGLLISPASFRTTLLPAGLQILRETIDMLPCLSLYADFTIQR